MLNVGIELDIYRNYPNLKSFKAKLVASYRPTPKSIFGIFNPISVQRLSQLRVGLSPLLEHKNNHNLLDTPSNICTTCNSPENLEHFFLYCICFVEFRLNLRNTIVLLSRNVLLLESNEKTRFLLYDDKLLSNATNKSVLKAYIY